LFLCLTFLHKVLFFLAIYLNGLIFRYLRLFSHWDLNNHKFLFQLQNLHYRYLVRLVSVHLLLLLKHHLLKMLKIYLNGQFLYMDNSKPNAIFFK